MVSFPFKDELSLIDEAALRAAGQMIASIESGRNISQKRKEDGSLVLELDEESQETIKKILGSTKPIASEEDPSSHRVVENCLDYFLVDPLDGTTACKRFMKLRNGQVGFGPLLGYVSNRKLVAASFFNIITRTLFSAVRGGGAFKVVVDPTSVKLPPEIQNRTRMVFDDLSPLRESAVLFYPGKRGELKAIEYFQRNNLIDTAFRFGGFANDSTRLAQGFEQVQIQFSIKAWDYSACLFPIEAGLVATFDPAGQPAEFSDWPIQIEANPVVICRASLKNELLSHLRQALVQ